MLLLGQGKLFAVYVASVLLHEYVHYLTALHYGLVMDEVKLYPYGAVLYGELSVLGGDEEIVVALAGPFFNLFIGIVCFALWWVVPAVYPYTDTIMLANLALGGFNLLPVYPLDGGRVLFNILLTKQGNRGAFRILKKITAVVAICFFAAYVCTAFYEINYTLALAALLVGYGLFTDKEELRFRKTYAASGLFASRGVMPVTVLAVPERLPLYRLLRKLHADCCYELLVMSESGDILARLSHAQLQSLFENNPSTAIIKDALGRVKTKMSR